jgi:ATP-binding cassette subfamily C protein
MIEKARTELRGKALWGFLNELYSQFRISFLLTLLLTMLMGLSEGLALLLLIPMLVASGIHLESGAARNFSEGIDRVFALFHTQPSLLAALVVFAVFVLVHECIARLKNIFQEQLKQALILRVRSRVFKKLLGVKWEYYVVQKPSLLVQALTEEVHKIGELLSILINIAVHASMMVVYLTIALMVSPSMTLVTACAGLLLAGFLRSRLVSVNRAGQLVTDAAGELQKVTSEHLAAFKTTRVYQQEQETYKHFEQAARNVQDSALEAINFTVVARFVFQFSSAVIFCGVLYTAIEILHLPVADILFLVVLFSRIMPRFAWCYSSILDFFRVLPSYNRIFQLEQEFVEKIEPQEDHQRGACIAEKEIVFDHVSYRYPESSRENVLSDLSVTFRVGETTAIVGQSGGGKSTLIDLLMGLLIPTEGAVRIDGRALSSTLMYCWRKELGYVGQEHFLFNDTVRANLSWASPSASEDELWRALGQAQADEFVKSFPDQLDQVVGHQGSLVSAGQAQRLAIARALLCKPRCLILDEATNALDIDNERRVLNAIRSENDDMTVILVSHRLSSITGADAIYLLENGGASRIDKDQWTALLNSASSNS